MLDSGIRSLEAQELGPRGGLARTAQGLWVDSKLGAAGQEQSQDLVFGNLALIRLLGTASLISVA